MRSAMSRNPFFGGKRPDPTLLRHSARRFLAWAMLGVGLAAAWLGHASAASEAEESALKCPEFKNLCVQAERSGGIDLKSGTAVLEGNVLGYLRSQELTFRAATLKAFQDDKGDWVRLVLDRNVRLTQPDGKAQADHSILEPRRILLFGNAVYAQGPLWIEGDEIYLNDETQQSTVKGSAEKPLLIRHLREPVPPAADGERGLDGIEPAPDGEIAAALRPETTVIQALRAEIEGSPKKMRFTGSVKVRREELDWTLTADSVRLDFDEEEKLAGFRAEGKVRIEQPERSLSADIAYSENLNETVVLVGNAKIVQQGQFSLTSDRIEVYSDAKKGVVQSQDRQRPITLELDLKK